MSNKDYLLEIGLEEMPARFVTDAMNQLKDKTEAWLREERLSFASVDAFSTPRRLALRVNGLAEKQEDKIEETRGPAKKIAVAEDGTWTKAALGFAKGQGLAPSELIFKDVKGIEYVFGMKEVKGKQTSEILAAVPDIVTGLTFPKNMRWGANSLRYVRPIHWIVSLYGEDVIPFQITGVQAGSQSTGHRFLGDTVELNTPAAYEKELLEQCVIVDPDERKATIRHQLNMIADEQNWVVSMNTELLEEVNNLVEYPTALYGKFEESFLDIPEEVLITSMREHQRYFPVEDASGKLLPYFVTVRNGNNEHLNNVQKGNEKVLRARLSDARFFYKEDQKLRPDEAAAKLDQIVFQEELGTIGDKVHRLQALVRTYGSSFGLDEKRIRQTDRAAALSKFDLVTLMVDEFTELQGLMGGKYARLAGEPIEVAQAIHEHYMPRFAGDEIPKSINGAIVSLADKLDTIVACFGIGMVPTGSQDPYGLRRQTAGVARILLEHEVPLPFDTLLDQTIDVLEKAGILKRDCQETKEDVLSFFRLRMKNMITERGVRYDIADAVLENTEQNVHVIVKTAEFLQSRAADPDFKETVEALSRVTNIAKKAEALKTPMQVDQNLLTEEQEVNLFRAYTETKNSMDEALKKADVKKAYEHLNKLQPAIHSYFDHIMVMTDNDDLKENRLAQMKSLALVIERYAHFSDIVFSA